MLGCVAAVIAMVSPSQPSPAVIHRMSISSMGEDIRVDAVPGPICDFFSRRNGRALFCVEFGAVRKPKRCGRIILLLKYQSGQADQKNGPAGRSAAEPSPPRTANRRSRSRVLPLNYANCENRIEFKDTAASLHDPRYPATEINFFARSY